jgi:hypothetical protein
MLKSSSLPKFLFFFFNKQAINTLDFNKMTEKGQSIQVNLLESLI